MIDSISSFSVEQFKSQFQSEPKPIILSDGILGTNIYSIPIKIFNLSIPIQIEFESSGLMSFILGEHIALSHKYKNENHSVVHQLYNSGIISKKTFALVFNKHNQVHSHNYSLYIGGIPINRKVNVTRKFTIKPNTTVTYWKFDDCKISFENNYDSNKYQVVLKLDNNQNMVDNATFISLHTMIFGKYLLTKEWKIVNQFFTYVICDKKLIQEIFIPKIYYVINGIDIEFKRNSIFDCEKK